MIANRYKDVLGFFVLKVDEREPSVNKFLIKWETKLEIGDAQIQVIANKEEGLKELVITYKQIYINIFTTMIMDISVDDQTAVLLMNENF